MKININYIKLFVIIFTFILLSFTIPQYVFASDLEENIIIENDFSESSDEENESNLSEPLKQVSDFLVDNIDELGIEEDFEDERIADNVEIEEDNKTINKYNNFNIKNNKVSVLNENSISTMMLEEDDLNPEAKNVEVGDEFLFLYKPTNTVYYVKVLNLDPFIYYRYCTYDMTNKKFTQYNNMVVSANSYFYYFLIESDLRKIYSIIKNNSSEVNLDNVDLQIDNTEIVDKMDRLETCLYISIFATSCLFGATVCKGLFNKL